MLARGCLKPGGASTGGSDAFQYAEDEIDDEHAYDEEGQDGDDDLGDAI
jgi:hypothetical protein